MNYKLMIDEKIAKDIHNLNVFDAEYSGNLRTLGRVINFIRDDVSVRSLQVCTENVNRLDRAAAYDRGFVAGINAIKQMFIDGCIMGSKLGSKHQKPPRIV